MGAADNSAFSVSFFVCSILAACRERHKRLTRLDWGECWCAQAPLSRQVPQLTPWLKGGLTSPAYLFGLTSYPKGAYLGHMFTKKEQERLELLQGTLDLLILRTLIFGPQHGQGIARAIQQISEDELLVEHGALYPALQRLEDRGSIAAEWGTSTNNRKARFYKLTSAGRKQLVKETTKWRRLAAAIGRILGAEG